MTDWNLFEYAEFDNEVLKSLYLFSAGNTLFGQSCSKKSKLLVQAGIGYLD